MLDPTRPAGREAIADRASRYLDRMEDARLARAALDELHALQSADARDLHEAVGDDVVILTRGVALVPFVEGAGARRGYEAMACLDLDALALKPLVRPYEPYEPDDDAADRDDDGPLGFDGRILDPRD